MRFKPKFPYFLLYFSEKIFRFDFSKIHTANDLENFMLLNPSQNFTNITKESFILLEVQIVNEGIIDGLMKEFFFSTTSSSNPEIFFNITKVFYTKFEKEFSNFSNESSLENDFDHMSFSNAKLLNFIEINDGYKFEFNPAINFTNSSLLKLYLIFENSEFIETLIMNFSKNESASIFFLFYLNHIFLYFILLKTSIDFPKIEKKIEILNETSHSKGFSWLLLFFIVALVIVIGVLSFIYRRKRKIAEAQSLLKTTERVSEKATHNENFVDPNQIFIEES